MPRCSESVAALASALAKAQAELVNPEKSLTVTIRSGRPGESERSYAPLTSGLNIVRKTLGRHEIATLLDLPRFRGRFRIWHQLISRATWSSCPGPFFCSAPCGAILPSRPA